MESYSQVAEYGLKALQRAGADKAQCRSDETLSHEFNVDSGELSLIRTMQDTSIQLTALKGQKRGSISLNRCDRESIDRAVVDVMDIADSSRPDPANDIAEAQEKRQFEAGGEKPDPQRMYNRLKSFLATVRKRYPKVVLWQVFLEFSHSRGRFLNSNGVDFHTRKGIYRCTVIFSSRSKEKVASFNYTGFSLRDLDRELIDCALVDRLLSQSQEEVETKPVQGKFTGDIVVAPGCMGDFLGFLTGVLRDGPIISGTSVYKDKVGEVIAAPEFSLHSRPVSEEIADGYFITSDGYAARNSTIVDQGVLQGFLLSLYGAKKTGRQRAPNDGGAYVMDPGTKSHAEIIGSVEKGILLTRFSGGNPSSNGDFSGVAKNSYLIEDGEVKHPISETMISGNLVDALQSISGISKERVDYGHSILPWMAMSGVTISGK